MALGARQQDVSRLVLRQGALVALTGVVIGLGAAAGLTRLMAALLFGVSPADPLRRAEQRLGLLSLHCSGVICPRGERRVWIR